MVFLLPQASGPANALAATASASQPKAAARGHSEAAGQAESTALSGGNIAVLSKSLSRTATVTVVLIGDAEAATSHGALSLWSCSISSWHSVPPFLLV